MRILRWAGYALLWLIAVWFAVGATLILVLSVSTDGGNISFPDEFGLVILVIMGVLWLIALHYHPSVRWLGYSLAWLVAIGLLAIQVHDVLRVCFPNSYRDDFFSFGFGLADREAAASSELTRRVVLAFLAYGAWVVVVRKQVRLRWALLAVLGLFWIPIVTTIGLGKLVIELLGRWNVVSGSGLTARAIVVRPRGLVGGDGE